MKRALLTFVFLGRLAYPATWSYIKENQEHHKFYADIDSVRYETMKTRDQHGNYVDYARIWVKETAGDNVVHRIRYELDVTYRRARVLIVYAYDHDGKVDETNSHDYGNATWYEIVPDSVAEALYHWIRSGK